MHQNQSELTRRATARSSRPEERSIALQGLANMGAHLRSVESVLFDLMEDSKHPSFKAISSIVKDRSEGPSQMGL